MSNFGIEFSNRFQSKIGDGLSSIERSRGSQGTAEADEGASEGKGTFADTLKNMIQDVNDAQLEADTKMQDVVAGRNKDLHGAMLAIEKADIQFRLLTQVRNKVIDAYREIMRMQV